MRYEIFISKTGYKEKPSEKEVKSLNINRERAKKEIALGNWKAHSVDIEYICEKLSNGHTITATITDKAKLLILDIDNHFKIIEAVEQLKKYNLYPNIIYQTFSHTEEKHKFRMIFLLEKEVDQIEYRALQVVFSEILEGKNDNCTKNMYQLIHGTNKKLKLFHRSFLNLEYTHSLKKKEEKKEHRNEISFPSSKKGFLNLNGVLEHFKIMSNSWHYNEALNIYIALRENGIDTSIINLVSEENREQYFKAFERAYNSGYKSEAGSTGAKLFGALKEIK